MANSNSKIPKIKKKISSFLTKEDGKISKDALIKAGLVASIGAGMVESVSGIYGDCGAHMNGPPPKASYCRCDESFYVSTGSDLSVDFEETTGELLGTHAHHSDHCSHASHSSHGSHGSHGSGSW